MINKIKQQLRTYGLNGFVGNSFWEIYMRLRWNLLHSFSQGGEDIIIDKLLKKKRGFYVDIGAYDPTRFSNTKRFYQKGWGGINIEPDPQRIKKFYTERPKDINLNIGIADKNISMKFYKFDPQTLSTFSSKTASVYQKQGNKLLGVTKIKVMKLANVLAKNAKGKKIDFFSIDTEGFDYQALKGNNWKKFKPKVICIETSNKKIDQLLFQQSYKKVNKTQINSIFYNE